DGRLGGGFRKSGVDASGVEPADAEFAEDMIPVDVARLDLRGGRVATVWNADGAADAKAAFGEIEAVANRATDAVILTPEDEVGGNATLHDEVLDEVADFVVDEGRDHGRLQVEALPQAAGRVVF